VHTWLNPLRKLTDSRRSDRRSRSLRMAIEVLDDRCVPTVFTVNSLADLSIAAGVDSATGAITGTNTVTLRSAIQAADATPGGNTIDLALTGTYRLTLPGVAGETDNAAGELAVLPTGGNLTIQNMSGGTVVLDGNHQSRVLDINPGFDPNNPTAKFLVTLDGLTIENGVAADLANPDGPNASGGGIRDNGNASLTLNDVIITGNSASADGGGVVFENLSSVPWTFTTNNTTIQFNHAGDAGGGVDADGSGKIFINAGTVIAGNTSVNQGAGIWLDAIQVGTVFQTANLTVTGAVIRSNTAQAGLGGGIGNAGNGTVTILNSTIAGNASGMTGGGFGDENNQGTLVVQNSLFQNNFAMAGGGIAVGSPLTTITSSEIDRNSSVQNGAGIFANGTTLTVLDSTFAGNASGGTGGGGLEIDTTGTGPGASTITNSTIYGNAADANTGSNGGGLSFGLTGAYTGATTLLNDTINGNFALTSGGVSVTGTGTVGVQNTIIAGNFAVSADPDYAPLTNQLISLGGNVIGKAHEFATFNKTGDQTNVDPLLSVLQSNGGPVVGAPASSQVLLTEAVLPGSPTIGKGLTTGAPATDERGFTRITGRVDSGALEFQPLASNIVLASSANPALFHQPASIVATVANVQPGTNVIPSGSVVFVVDGVAQTPVPLVNGAATFTLPAALAPGAHTIAVGYTGDSTLGVSMQTLTETVSQVATTTMLMSSANPSLLGQPVTFAAAITSLQPGAGTPTGNVIFSLDGMPQSPMPLVNGMATLTVTNLTVGTHNFTALYAGDTTFLGSATGIMQTVRGVQDVTHQVTITPVQPQTGRRGRRVKVNKAQPTLQITNISGATIQGPIYLVLDGLTTGVMLQNASGTSQTHVTPGDPFITLTGDSLAAGQSVTATLVFTANTRRLRNLLAQIGPRFTPFVLAGPGTV
jgi:hypothetical protein